MLLQIKNKKGISVMIGYVLLISSLVVMGGIVYQWMKTFVPTEVIDCPDGVSIYIRDVKCENVNGSYQLNLELRNNGRFDIGGYFIHIADNPNQELATIDITENLISSGIKMNPGIKFDIGIGEDNSFKPNKDVTNVFILNNTINLVEIIPLRFQEDDNKNKFVSCGNSKVKEVVTCI
ncbi:hypothetical protein CMI40_00800 [Candidatus Pacearchaeota archaeon]|jgi:hypothetical protein|nr:hypothetical protein [Candidatus Pacearchaeota archaeon]|tara:strand:- start:10074 stop:10607 length:534 start_codon:yes stop_codon:yes gene_type:complete